MKTETTSTSDSIVVSVKLYGALRSRRPAGVKGDAHHAFAFSLNPNATVQDLLDALDIPGGRLSAVAVNGQAAGREETLNESDQVSLFPPVAGGDSFVSA